MAGTACVENSEFGNLQKSNVAWQIVSGHICPANLRLLNSPHTPGQIKK
jgi:hypothetical protein